MFRIGLVGCGAIETDSQPPHSGVDNLDTMEIVDGVYLSAEREEPAMVAELRAGAGIE